MISISPIRKLICLAVLAVLILAPSRVAAQAQIATEMTQRALAFLQQLQPHARVKAQMAFDDRERENWRYVPAARKGLALKQMDPVQRQQAFALLKSGLSASGYEKANNILFLEGVLRELENSDYRDPELYYISIFGEPANDGTWGWRFEGHHLSLNFTIIDGQQIATAPNFWGANPARVPLGTLKGLRTLAQEEDLARGLMQVLTAEQKKIAQVSEQAPRDIETGDARRAVAFEAEGISYDRLDTAQRRQLMGIINTYLNNMPSDVAAQRRERILQSDRTNIHFAWRGKIARGARHYYRLRGDTFLIEYDNYQNQANHIHTVWRDFNGDFGRDLLRAHLAQHTHLCWKNKANKPWDHVRDPKRELPSGLLRSSDPHHGRQHDPRCWYQ